VPNFYRILGVKPTATPAEIKRAFRRAAKAAHPDAGGTAERMRLVKHAYDVLSDAKSRRQYDASHKLEVSDWDFRPPELES